MTSFSFEVPIPHLEDFDDLQDFVFALSFLGKDERYMKWLQKHAEAGLKTIWLDNSFNELGEADSSYELAKVGRNIQATCLISPDDPGWSTSQIASAFRNMTRWWEKDRLVAVVKNVAMYNHMRSEGAKHFAISYHVRRNCSLSKLRWVKGKNIHFLGLIEDIPRSIKELTTLKPPSCDTSRPIKLALQGISMKQPNCQVSYHPPGKDKLTYFYTEMTTAQIDLARANITYLKEVTNEQMGRSEKKRQSSL